MAVHVVSTEPEARFQVIIENMNDEKDYVLPNGKASGICIASNVGS